MENQSEFKYDVYISFRRNDQNNEWIKEFVSRLNSELKSLSRYEINILYDARDNDSISGALVFIPVLSTGYCNKEEETWQEFIRFKQLCSQDNIGLNLKLSDYITVSRILPVKINPLPIEDVRLLEAELEGQLRSVEFIFDIIEGVIRPLQAKDDGFGYGDILYQSQITKTANYIIQIIQAYRMIKGIEIATAPLMVGTDPSVPPNVVYLAWTANDCRRIRDELAHVLQKAGMLVLPAIDCPVDDASLKEKIHEAMQKARCTIHIMGNEAGKKLDTEDVYLSLYQINEAKKLLESNKDFRLFIWNASSSLHTAQSPEQKQIIVNIRNNLVQNMVFTNVPSPVQLVDDIRALLSVKKKIDEIGEAYNVVFMFNFLDEDDAGEIIEMLSDVLKVDPLVIGEDPTVDYGPVSVKYIKNSKLAVIFFREASAWAIPYVQQIWKMMGGASSATPIFLIGDNSNDENIGKIFKAPKVYSKIVSRNLIPIEIKALYDTIVEEQ